MTLIRRKLLNKVPNGERELSFQAKGTSIKLLSQKDANMTEKM